MYVYIYTLYIYIYIYYNNKNNNICMYVYIYIHMYVQILICARVKPHPFHLHFVLHLTRQATKDAGAICGLNVLRHWAVSLRLVWWICGWYMGNIWLRMVRNGWWVSIKMGVPAKYMDGWLQGNSHLEMDDDWAPFVFVWK